MRRIRLLATLGVLVAASAVGLAAVAAGRAGGARTPGDVAIEAMWQSAVNSARDGEPEGVVMALERAMGDDVFGALSPGRKREVALLYGQAADRLGEWDEAHRAFVRAIEAGQDDGETWLLRLHTAIIVNDAADARLAFDHMRTRGPVLGTFALNQLEHLDQLMRGLPDPNAHLIVAQQVDKERWSSPYAYEDASTIRLHYVEALLDAGDTQAAAAAAGRITDPMVMMAMQADRRFDAVVAANPALQDPKAVAECDLERARAFSAAHPRLISGRLAVVHALEVLNRPAEALPILDDTVRTIVSAPRSQPPFDDMDQRAAAEHWRSSILLSLGRTEEAIGSRMAAAQCHCSADSVLNLARTLMNDQRPQDAQQWLEDSSIRGLDPQRVMELSQVKVCVAAQLGDQAGVDRELTYLRRNADRRPDALTDALVCADRLDEAEQTVLAQLDNPRTRLVALNRLQAYAQDATPMRYERVTHERWLNLGARPAVRAKALAVGRLNTFPLKQWAALS